jgi:hypothetical protein
MFFIVQLPQTLQIKILREQNRNTFKQRYVLYTKLVQLTITNLGEDSFYLNASHTLIIKRPGRLKTFQEANTLRRMQQFLFILSYWRYVRIYYTGKGYKIKKYKTKNLLSFFFGACHVKILNIPEYILKFKKRRSFSLYYKSTLLLKYNLNQIMLIKPLNLYTQRGLKHSKQIIYKKPKRKATFI